MKLDKDKLKISKETVDKVFTGRVELTNADDLDLGKSLTDLIVEARKAALKEGIRANTVMISKRLAKVNRFVQVFPDGYADFPPLICGLEAFVTDEMPEEFAFGLVEAPMTQREAVFEDGRLTGYNQGYREGNHKGYEQGVKDMAERIKNYYRHTTSKPLPATVEYYVSQIAKEMVENMGG
jgi:hypothetical protein